jgi:arylsulfatase A-like enzyme
MFAAQEVTLSAILMSCGKRARSNGADITANRRCAGLECRAFCNKPRTESELEMKSRPNLLIILSDQLRRQALSCYGETNLETSHIDALAQNGVRFSNSCSTYPICVPFRFTLMTGQYAHSRVVPGINWRMSPVERTLADEFNEAGYETAYIGKWHLYGGAGPSHMKRPVPREHQGRWQKWLGFEFRNSHFDTVYFQDDDPTPKPLGAYQTDGLFDLAMEYLRERSDVQNPFCCVVSVEPPHPPFEAPPALEEKWLQRDLDLPPNFLKPPAASELEVEAGAKLTGAEREETLRRDKLYYAMVENLDDNVGRLMEFIRAEGLDENTIVVFLSDHGELNGSHNLSEKQYPYEESIGIPLIIWGPGCGIPSGVVLDDPTCTEDLFPTLCGLAGHSPREVVPGSDLSTLICGECDHLARPGVLLEFVQELRPGVAFHRQPYRGFRSRRYKYTVLGTEKGMQPWQFFDLEKDPFELNNLVADGDSEPLIRRHHEWLRERMVETGDHEWLAAAFGSKELHAWVPCHIGG